MFQPVSVQIAGAVAIVTIDAPPVNALSAPVRAALGKAFSHLSTNSAVDAVILGARGRSYVTGEAPEESDAPKDAPSLSDLNNLIEAFSRPVVAAVHGTLDGAGLELAMAAHYRLADRRTRFGFPEVRLGLTPRGGGTQRLPRLVGAKSAADLLLSAQEIDASTAKQASLIDAVAAGPLPDFAMGWIKARLPAGLPVRPTRDLQDRLTPKRDQIDQLHRLRDALPKNRTVAHVALLDMLETVFLLPFDAAIEKERAVFEDCLGSNDSRGLRHAAAAEARAGTPAVAAGAAPGPLNRIGVAGGGRMGRGIAMACLDAGLQVTLVERGIDTLEDAVEGIIDLYDQDIAQGRLDAAARDRRLTLLAGKTDVASLAEVDLVIEAVEDEAQAKRRMFSALDAILKRDAILATATTAIDLDGLAAGTGRPEFVVGLHFFPPSHQMRAVEVVLGLETSDATIVTAFEFVTRIGKIPVATAVSDGYLAYRMISSFLDAALFALCRGADIAVIDAALEDYGFPLGPFHLADAIGVDEMLRYQAGHSSEMGLVIREVLSRMVAAGHLGRRHGRGFYTYQTGGQEPVPNPDLPALLHGLLTENGAMSANEIRGRCLSALANQGARLVEDEIAHCPSDLDVLMMQVFGYPRRRGGAMMGADLTGLPRVRRDLEAFSQDCPEIWTPAPLFAELERRGEGFASLNKAMPEAHETESRAS